MVRHTGTKVYSPASVVAAIESALGRQVRLFGQSTGDQGIVALTRHGMERFLDEDATDPLGYVMDHGGRNYDCEKLRRNPALQLGPQARCQRVRRNLGRLPHLVPVRTGGKRRTNHRHGRTPGRFPRNDSPTHHRLLRGASRRGAAVSGVLLQPERSNEKSQPFEAATRISKWWPASPAQRVLAWQEFVETMHRPALLDTRGIILELLLIRAICMCR